MAESTRSVSRRGFLAGAGSTAVLATAPIAGCAAAPAAPMNFGASATAGSDLPLAEIQGNILGGFNKDHQTIIAVAFPGVAAARAWLAAVVPHVASAAEVSAFNTAFRAARARTGSEQAAPRSTWLNVAMTFPGLRALGVSPGDLGRFPREFQDGMAARADRIGDVGDNAPSKWPTPFRRQAHAVLIIAADLIVDLSAAVAVQQRIATQFGVNVLWVQEGAARADQPGHEHFGFKDGVSQPGIRGFTQPTDPSSPNQGVPGQDLLWPGEFVLGQPRQAGAGADITAKGPIAVGGPAWAANGSYLVFRRLRQDVAGFREFVSRTARTQGVSEDLMGAKIVGRYKSGAPLEVTGAQSSDPGISDPSLLTDAKVNKFEFGDDPDGAVVPLASHIRKSYPRDEPTREGGESDTQTHRLLRRGIPYGASLSAGASATSPAARATFPDDRGLLFLCYQTSIARQFEFVQSRWVNDPNFPRRGAGQDPVIAQTNTPGSFTLPGGKPDHVALMNRFVTTTGGDYFFQPSLSALRALTVNR